MNANYSPPPRAGLATVLLCLSLSGCDTPATRVDQHFGQAVQQNQAQPLSERMPQARARTRAWSPPPNPSAWHETDGVSAKAAVDRYHENLQAPAAAPRVFNFNLGAAAAR
jgi:hypothetical protein